MYEVPGVFDGTKYADLRLLLPQPIQDHYVAHDQWHTIVKCKFYEFSQVVWRERRSMGKVYYWMEKWQCGTIAKGVWSIVDDQMSETFPK